MDLEGETAQCPYVRCIREHLVQHGLGGTVADGSGDCVPGWTVVDHV
jgi:hypothetical protein